MVDVIPERVDLSRADCCWIGSTDQPGVLRPEFAPATYAWKTRDLSPTGTMGDATRVAAEKGAAWIDAGAERLAAVTLEACRTPAILGSLPAPEVLAGCQSDGIRGNVPTQ